MINIQAYVDLHKRSGDIHMHTNGFITVTEKARAGTPSSSQTNFGDLRVGQIVSTNDDVTLYSPGAILDADEDVAETASDAIKTIGTADVSGGDVVGRNITMSAGDTLTTGAPIPPLESGAISGHGGVGVPANFLELVVNADGGAFGVLNITDTASARTGWNIDALPAADPGAPTGTFGVFVTQSNLDMEVDRILTNGDASLVARNGSLMDGRGGGSGDNSQFSLANVEANNIDLGAYCDPQTPSPNCGDVGARGPPYVDQLGNDFKIDSGHGDTQHPSTVIVGRVGIEAQNNIYLTETLGALNVLVAQALNANARLTVREHSIQGDDLNLILPYASDTVAPTQNRNAILIDYSGVANVKRDIIASNPSTDGVINSPSINAEKGWILLRVGDNVTLGGLDLSNYPGLTDAQRIAQNTKVVAGKWIDIHGDYDAFSLGVSDPDSGATGHGTVMHLHGTITPGPLTATAPDCLDEIDPGRDCNVTRIFGNTDTDTINFDQTFLGGRTIAFGSSAPTCTAHAAACMTPGMNADSEDFFNVNRLQTMFDATLDTHTGNPLGNGDNPAGHTLTLDGQVGTDTYVINTTGSQACLGANQISGATCHNYVINALDTGAPDDGADVLIVNGSTPAGRLRLAGAPVGRRRLRLERQPVPDRRHLPAARDRTTSGRRRPRSTTTRSPTTRRSSRCSTATSARRRRSRPRRTSRSTLCYAPG